YREETRFPVCFLKPGADYARCFDHPQKGKAPSLRCWQRLLPHTAYREETRFPVCFLKPGADYARCFDHPQKGKAPF
ncbi:hypothetical protein, partial [Halalkalibacter oceani]|uniref:hypothetical protein n=1 Tax=Halalkalibacter oceani TaxID=1653776 RepID=UPI003397427B